MSKDFDSEKGVQQGGLLSTYLYNDDTAELSSKLEEAKVGCCRLCGLPGYANDFNIICNLNTLTKSNRHKYRIFQQ